MLALLFLAGTTLAAQPETKMVGKLKYTLELPVLEEVAQGAVLPVKLTVENPLPVAEELRIQTSCGCLHFSYSKIKLKPRSTREIKGEFAAEKAPGRFRYHLILSSRAVSKDIRVEGKIVQCFKRSARVMLVRRQAQDPWLLTGDLNIWPVDPKHGKVTRVESSSDQLKLKLTQKGDTASITAETRLKKGDRPERHTITVHTTNARLPRFTIPVHASFGLSASPNQLSFYRKPSLGNKYPTLEVAVSSYDGSDLGQVTIVKNPDWIKLKKRKLNESTVLLTVTITDPPEQKMKRDLQLLTSNMQQPQITIPISVRP